MAGRVKSWSDSEFNRAIRNEHLQYAEALQQGDHEETLLSFIKRTNGPLTSEIGRRSKTSSWNGEILEKCEISTWLHYKEKRPLGRNTQEKEMCLMHFWAELKKASKLLDCQIALNDKISPVPIPAPPHFKAEMYGACRECGCRDHLDDSITGGAAIKALRRELGENWKEILSERESRGLSEGGLLIPKRALGISIRDFVAISYALDAGDRGPENEVRQELMSRLSATSQKKVAPDTALTLMSQAIGVSTNEHNEEIGTVGISIAQKIITRLQASNLEIDASTRAKLLCVTNHAKGARFHELSMLFEEQSGSAGIQKARATIKSYLSAPEEWLIKVLYEAANKTAKINGYLYGAISELHRIWEQERNKREISFDINYLKSKNTEIGRWAASQRSGIRDVLALSGINPDCHCKEYSYGNSIDEQKKAAVKMIRELAMELGVQNLNAKTIGVDLRTKQVPITPEENYNHRYPICNAADCKLRQPRYGAFFVKCQSLFGSWEKAIEASGIDYQKSVIRKVHRVPKEEIMLQLDEYTQKNPDWTVAGLKRDEKTLYRNCYKKRDQNALLFAEAFNGDTMRAIHAELSWRKHGARITPKEYIELNKQVLDKDWELRRNFDDTAKERGRLFEQWFKGELISAGFKEVTHLAQLDKHSFLHNKVADDSEAKVRPDFRFESFIVDTKTTYFKYQKKTIDQFTAYSTLANRLYCVTLSQQLSHQIEQSILVQVTSIHKVHQTIEEFSCLRLDRKALEAFTATHSSVSVKD